MIEFSGMLTGDCRKYAIKSIRIRFFVAMVLTSIVVTLPCVYISYLVQEKIILLFLIGPAYLLFVASLPPSKGILSQTIPFRVRLNCEENTFIYEVKINRTRSSEDFKMIDDIVKVIDYGEWYTVIIPIGLVGRDINCQKDLLTQGTLEEFEALFEGKIERRIKGNTNSK